MKRPAVSERSERSHAPRSHDLDTGSTWDGPSLDRPGNADIQLDMLYDYRTNVPLYPDFQAFFRKFKPPKLIVWGKRLTTSSR
jgi:hypothetical protein